MPLESFTGLLSTVLAGVVVVLEYISGGVADW
jgi:hypothetical protein